MYCIYLINISGSKHYSKPLFYFLWSMGEGVDSTSDFVQGLASRVPFSEQPIRMGRMLKVKK